VSTEIARRLLSYLLAGHVRPGEKIPSERKLAEVLGVGRSVVREAIKSLTLLGLLDVRQGDGTYLRGTESELLPQSIEWGLLLGLKRTRDLVEARQYLEVIMAGLAAERRSDEDLVALRSQMAEMQAAGGDPDRFVAADIAFHLRIAQAARNESLAQIMSSIRSLLQVWISRVMHVDESFAPSVAEHVRILAAMEAADPGAARDAMQGHMDGAFTRLEGTLDEHAASLPAGSA
jgi:GntR family transcriptional regulator, transcriptional repressor for pyruvate dehydrogenase complex